jgi:hypothetical protein
MMRWILLCLALALAPARAAEVAGVKFAEALEVAPGATLALNGAGIRKRAFFDVYAMGLYLPAKKSAPAEVLALAGPKRVAITMLRDVGADQFAEALADGVRANHPEAEAKALEPRLQQLTAIMVQLKEARKGLRVDLDWTPGAGTRVSIDGKPAGAPIAGEDFYRALLRIWLGDKPASSDLKDALLGKTQ